jgi:probable phosphoglycerate mutase
MTTWIFARHGQSTANAVPMLSGHMDVALTDLGREQAATLGAALRSHRIARVVSSDLSRAYDTAVIAMRDRPHAIRTTPRLRERHLGSWTGLHYDDMHRVAGPNFLSTLDAAPPDGESLRDVALRVFDELDAMDDGLPTLVVAHGGVLRAVLGLFDARPAVHVQRAFVVNAAPHVRVVPKGTWGELRDAVRRAPFGGTS